MSKAMRAKLVVSEVTKLEGNSERIKFRAVGRAGPYPDSGEDENNTYAQFTPQCDAEMFLNNPALLDTYKPGDTFYVNFEPVDLSEA